MAATFVKMMESHLNLLMAAPLEPRRANDTAMWPSMVDTRSGGYPQGDHVPQRVYRLIGAPRGSTLYWDQPLVMAAYELTRLTGTPRYAQAADAYIQAFLAACVDQRGMFQWGNHQYYDLWERRVVSFSGGHHELRPLTPAWEVFWRHDAERTAAYIRTMARRHVYDPATGGFNRHDDGRRGHAFLEAGGILVESLAWLFGKTGAEQLRDLALGIARYSYGHRGESTGLLRNEPDKGRWDAQVATTEVGLWAQCLLRASRYAAADEFIAMARNAVRAYLAYGYDHNAARYYGQISVDSGAPVTPTEKGYWPRQYSRPWNTDQWPTHDYPLALAQACLSLYGLTGEQPFREAVQRWARIAIDERPARTGQWAYAENYGRCLGFLVRAGRELDEESWLAAAQDLAQEAVADLYENGMFQGFSGGHVYESVDGVGCLLRAFMALDSGHEVDAFEA